MSVRLFVCSSPKPIKQLKINQSTQLPSLKQCSPQSSPPSPSSLPPSSFYHFFTIFQPSLTFIFTTITIITFLSSLYLISINHPTTITIFNPSVGKPSTSPRKSTLFSRESDSRIANVRPSVRLSVRLSVCYKNLSGLIYMIYLPSDL